LGPDGQGVESAATVMFTPVLRPLFKFIAVVQEEVAQKIALVKFDGLFEVLAACLADE
jgi:hypothetical protein